MGDDELAVRVIGVFRTDVRRQIQVLRDALKRGDAPGSSRYAHSIKGAAANVGGERLRAVALDLENAAGTGNLSAAKDCMAALEAEFCELDDAMEADGVLPKANRTVNPEGEARMRRGSMEADGAVRS
jgi:HPt (histidine-containing phosphotransfer) domain-containing protein